jgi:hypothetical protein
MGQKKEKIFSRRNMGWWCFLVKCKEGNENVRRTIRKVCVGEIYLGSGRPLILLAKGG